MSNKEMFVPLSPAELSACRQAATFRWQMARAAGVENQRRDGNRSDEDVDYLGIRAELAVAKLYGLDYSPHHLGVDDGVDMYCETTSIDVKSTFHTTGKLLLKSKKFVTADLYILVTACSDESLMRVVGGITSDQFLEHCVKEDLGHGNGLSLTQDKLAAPSAVWRFLMGKRFLAVSKLYEAAA